MIAMRSSSDDTSSNSEPGVVERNHMALRGGDRGLAPGRTSHLSCIEVPEVGFRPFCKHFLHVKRYSGK